jgi:hypothetical protein
MPKVHRTTVGAYTEFWGYPAHAHGSHKLGTLGPARQGAGFQASREMKSGLEFQVFVSEKAAEDWIAQADAWGPLR